MRLLWAVDHGLQRLSKRMAATMGLTGPQRLVVRMVGRFPGISAGRLARVLHLHPSTLTGILVRLERRGLLTRRRDPRDARRVVLGLSATGRRLDVETPETVEAEVKGLLARVPRREILATQGVLVALAQQLDSPPTRGRDGRRPRG
jgi:DNA-binding MarR family transcriptional regulator